MFITLTNAVPALAGERILINADSIVTIHSKLAERDSGILEQVTYIHCPPHGTWEVQETLDQITELLAND